MIINFQNLKNFESEKRTQIESTEIDECKCKEVKNLENIKVECLKTNRKIAEEHNLVFDSDEDEYNLNPTQLKLLMNCDVKYGKEFEHNQKDCTNIPSLDELRQELCKVQVL